MYRSTTFLVSFLVTCGLSRIAIANDTEAASSFARRGMVAAMLGDQDRRSDLLTTAIEKDPNNAMANWASGRVSVNDDWVKIEDYEQQMQANRLLSVYERHRSDVKSGKLTEMQLADWCREQQLYGREKLHLSRIWQSDSARPDLKFAAARRLGMQQIGGIWMTPAEVRELRRSVQTIQANAAKWRPATLELVNSLETKDAHGRRRAVERYQRGLDATAIVSMESLLSVKGEPFARLAVKLIGNLPDYEATQSLVRHAVFVDSESVRQAAAQQLQDRPQEESVPLLLAQLANPLEGQFGISVGPDGMVRQTQQVMERRRGANIRHVQSTARGIHRVNQVQVRANRSGGVRVVANTDDLIVARALDRGEYSTWEERLVAEANLRRRFALQRQRLIQQEVLRAAGLNRSLQLRNQRTAAMNEHVIAALKTITEQDVEPATASGWWDWWNEENERYQAETPTYTRYAMMADPMEVTYARSCECFPAGTLVRTQTGLRRIESIQAGDQVLSKHTETGELDYKLVLATTVRPPSSMVTVGFEGGSIDATSGHLFWVEEQGWKMAKKLKPYDLIHGLNQSKRVVSVETRPDAEAHNLVVSEFGTYYVGDDGIFVHDNSERRRSNTVTPGIDRVTKR